MIFRDDDDDHSDSSELSDEESRPTKPTLPVVNENQNMDDSNAQLINHDWSFLSSILPENDTVQ